MAKSSSFKKETSQAKGRKAGRPQMSLFDGAEAKAGLGSDETAPVAAETATETPEPPAPATRETESERPAPRATAETRLANPKCCGAHGS